MRICCSHATKSDNLTPSPKPYYMYYDTKFADGSIDVYPPNFPKIWCPRSFKFQGILGPFEIKSAMHRKPVFIARYLQ